MRYISILVFTLVYLAVTLAWRIPNLVAVAYAGASVICFIAYARDKSAAKTGRRRTPEITLLWLGFACGWPGAILAQQWLRHKSSKVSFRQRFWATVALNIGAFIYLSSPASFMHQF